MEARSRILQLATAEGFDPVRIAPATVLEGARAAALAARDGGRLEGMDWMSAEWLTRATDPRRFLPGAASVILCALPCHSPEPAMPGDSIARGRFARYARGRDYHRTFEKKLRRLAAAIRSEFEAQARPTVDYGPLLERPLAAVAGLGWQGKSTMLLVPGAGPWVMLGAVATTLALEPDPPLRKSCGSCTRCVVACPTGALGADGGLLDARLCISYHTIENRGVIPRDLRSRFGDWVFGCDECLDSCPVGASSFETHPDFTPPDIEASHPALRGLLELDEESFRARFRGRAIMRARRDGLVRNVCIAVGNVGTAGDVPALAAALKDSSPLVRGHAAWALGRLFLRTCAEPARAALIVHQQSENDPYVLGEIAAALEECST